MPVCFFQSRNFRFCTCKNIERTASMDLKQVGAPSRSELRPKSLAEAGASADCSIRRDELRERRALARSPRSASCSPSWRGKSVIKPRLRGCLDWVYQPTPAQPGGGR